MRQDKPEAQFVVCVKNDEYLASLEVRKIYRTLPDANAAAHGLVRVIDESGEDYLYPADFFRPHSAAAARRAGLCLSRLRAACRTRNLVS
jgi:hypothetical protein